MRRLLSLSAIALAAFLSASAFADEAAKGSISGKVVDKDGNAVKTGKVFVMNPADLPARGGRGGGTAPAKQAEEPKAGEKPGAGGGRGPGGPNFIDKAVAKGDIVDGAYKIADVPAGKYVVIATATGAGRGRANVEVTAGQETKVDDIKLEPFQPRGGGRGGAGGGKAPAEGAK